MDEIGGLNIFNLYFTILYGNIYTLLYFVETLTSHDKPQLSKVEPEVHSLRLITPIKSGTRGNPTKSYL